jgi:ABC-type uncharacterized transport system permease subunit
MYLPLLIGVACAVLFYRAAEYERMSPWAWVLASLGLSFAISFLHGSIVLALLAQVGLFGVMWWYNARRTPRP